MAEQTYTNRLDKARGKPVHPGRRRSTLVEGFCHPDFKAVDALLRRQLRKYPGGVALCVHQHGECVVDMWGGNRDAEGRPWLRDTMAPSFSTTKGICSTLLHIFADRGLVDYDENVATYWPEFGQAGKSRITVRQVMSHQSGLYHIRQMIDDAGRMLDWPHMVEAIEKATPIHTPGSRTGYHAFTYGFILGEIIQRVTGKSFSELVQSEIAIPLGLDGLYIGAPEGELHRAAHLLKARPLRRMSQRALGYLLERQINVLDDVLKTLGINSQLRSFHDALAPRGIADFDFGSAETLQAAIPAANGLFTARALSKVYAMLAGGGEFDGVRLLSEETVARARALEPSPGRHAVIPLDLRWRLGYHGVYTSQGILDEAYGHFGIGGSGGWADPTLDLSVALIANGGAGSPLVRLSSVVRKCAATR